MLSFVISPRDPVNVYLPVPLNVVHSIYIDTPPTVLQATAVTTPGWIISLYFDSLYNSCSKKWLISFSLILILTIFLDDFICSVITFLTILFISLSSSLTPDSLVYSFIIFLIAGSSNLIVVFLSPCFLNEVGIK